MGQGAAPLELKTITLLDGLEFPESPRWHDKKLWFSDMGSQLVMNVDLAGRVQTVAQVPAEPSGLGWLPDGRLLVVSMQDRRLLRWESGKLVEAANLAHLASFHLNDMVVNSQGNAYIGTFGYDFKDPAANPQPGEIVLVKPSGEAHVAVDGLAFPNGMVITPDQRTLIVAEMFAARLTAFDLNADGSLTGRRVWAQFDERGFEGRIDFRRITPDGICLDAEGAIWLASPGGNSEVLRVLEGGRITHRIPVEHEPFACMLGGPGRRTLFICTSLFGEKPPGTGRIEIAPVEVPGAGFPSTTTG